MLTVLLTPAQDLGLSLETSQISVMSPIFLVTCFSVTGNGISRENVSGYPESHVSKKLKVTRARRCLLEGSAESCSVLSRVSERASCAGPEGRQCAEVLYGGGGYCVTAEMSEIQGKDLSPEPFTQLEQLLSMILA